MACKLPVIISHKVNIWREIVDDKAGLVVENTTQGIIDGLIQWLNLTEAEKSTMGHRAQQSFMQRFEMNEVANHLMKTLTSYGIES
jgi:glycosyltransferase involved in cell wall biosynthesis